MNKEQVDIVKLRNKITKESVAKQIEDGWTNPFFIAEEIIGTDTWRTLPEWDKRILMANVHKIAVDNENLRKKYFA